MSSNIISIKGTRDGLIIVFDPNQEFELIKKHLLLKMEAAQGFFKGAKFALYDKQSIPDNQQCELEAICCNYGLVPSPLKTGAAQTLKNNRNEAPTHESAESELDGENALLVRANLRGGQNIAHPGNVVVVGNVHPGAEITASGNILIMGNCRGHIHAGATGDEQAKVIAFRLAPAIISIAGVLARSSGKNKTPNPYPEVAFLQSGKIIVKRHR